MAKQLPSDRAPSAPAPKRLRLKSQAVTTSLPPGAQLLVDDAVGSFLGATRSEVLRFIVVSWLSDHHALLKSIGERKR